MLAKLRNWHWQRKFRKGLEHPLFLLALEHHLQQQGWNKSEIGNTRTYEKDGNKFTIIKDAH